jgi:serine/threonine protein phosphatase PrpC
LIFKIHTGTPFIDPFKVFEMTLSKKTTIKHYSAQTHVGLVREVNEDAIIALPQLGIWVVSDGMGGHDGGDFASQTVINTLAALPYNLAPTDIVHATRNALNMAHRAIRQEANKRGNVTIGATVTLLVLTEEHFMCLWAGDSRLYRLRGDHFEMISVDHSVVGEMVEAGQLTWSEAASHPEGNHITRAVGVGNTLEIDKRRGDVQPGDRFLLCSDGLTKYADDPTLHHHLIGTSVKTAVDQLLQVALDGGAADNVSIILIEA